MMPSFCARSIHDNLPGVEVTAAEGDVVIFPSGNVSDTRAGAEGATLLVLEIVTAEDGAATPAG